MPRIISRKGWHKKCWDLQSQQIRKNAADFQDYVECYTCGVPVLWKEAQVGHFWHNKLDFDPRNLKIQCVRCNHFLRGNLGKYAARLIKENGLEWYEQLEIDAARYKGETIIQLKQIWSLLKSTTN